MLRDMAFFANLNVASFWFAIFFNFLLGVVFLFAYGRAKAVLRREYLAFALTLWSGATMMLFSYLMQQYCETVHPDTIMSTASMLLALRFYQMQLVFSGITAVCMMSFAIPVTNSFFRKNALENRWHFLVLIYALGAFSPQVLRVPGSAVKGDDFNYSAIGPLFLPYVLVLTLLAFCAYAVMTYAVWPDTFKWLPPLAQRIGITLGNPSYTSDKPPSLLQKFIKPIWMGVAFLFVGCLLEALEVVFADQGDWGIPMNPRIVGWILLDTLVAAALLSEMGHALFERKTTDAEVSNKVNVETPNNNLMEPQGDNSEKEAADARETEEDKIWSNYKKLSVQLQEIAKRSNKTTSEIAKDLKLGEQTVRQYLSKIYDIMEVRSKKELAAVMTRIGLIK